MATFIQIIIGQNNSNYLIHKIITTHTDQCHFREEEETFFHLIIECPVFTEYRLTNLNGFIEVGSLEWHPRELLDFAALPRKP